MATAAKSVDRALRDGGRLRIGHLRLHPNSLKPADRCRNGVIDSPRTSSIVSTGHLRGCLSKTSLSALVSVQFHLPILSEAMELLESLCGASCFALRKIVDRQSRWRPRAQRFDSLDESGRARAAALADNLGNSLRNLRHVEGPIFSLLLRARGRQVSTDADAPASGQAALPTDAGCADQVAAGLADNTSEGGAQQSQGLGGCVEIVHLVDATAGDLLGLWAFACMRLQKLVLLNLPATTPGNTVTAVTKFLPRAPKLTELQLDFQFFDPSAWELEALEALVNQVQAPPSKMQKLLLEWCRLGDAGVRCVCQALARHAQQHQGHGIVELSLAHCEVRNVKSVCEMLETPGLALTKLDLSSNALDDLQASCLAQSLPLSSVKELRLRDSQISVPLPVKTEWFWGC